MIDSDAIAQRSRKAKRTRNALRYKRDQGQRLGTTPLGLRTPEPGAPMIPDIAELDAARHILRRRRSRGTFRAMAAELTAAGYRTKRGATWHGSTVRAVWERRAAYRSLLEGAA